MSVMGAEYDGGRKLATRQAATANLGRFAAPTAVHASGQQLEKGAVPAPGGLEASFFIAGSSPLCCHMTVE
jgi:hypothetical protein